MDSRCPAALLRSAVSGIGDHQTPHHGRGKGKELDAIAPVVPGTSRKLQEGFVDQDCRTDRSVRAAAEVIFGEGTKFLKDTREQRLDYRLVSRAPGAQECRDLAHRGYSIEIG